MPCRTRVITMLSRASSGVMRASLRQHARAVDEERARLRLELVHEEFDGSSGYSKRVSASASDPPTARQQQRRPRLVDRRRRQRETRALRSTCDGVDRRTSLDRGASSDVLRENTYTGVRDNLAR